MSKFHSLIKVIGYLDYYIVATGIAFGLTLTANYCSQLIKCVENIFIYLRICLSFRIFYIPNMWTNLHFPKYFIYYNLTSDRNLSFKYHYFSGDVFIPNCYVLLKILIRHKNLKFFPSSLYILVVELTLNISHVPICSCIYNSSTKSSKHSII